MKRKIAYIDESPQWISTFYHSFKEDFEILKIRVKENHTVNNLVKRLFQNKLDAIVTDYLLEEEGDVAFNGNAIVEEVRKYNAHFPIVMLTSYESQAISFMDDVHIIYGKSIFDGESEEELALFKSKIKSNISNYYKKKRDTDSRIKHLVEKKNNEGLNLFEEEELTKLYILHDELNPNDKDLPANIIHHSSISKLNEFVNETKEILKELKIINQNK